MSSQAQDEGRLRLHNSFPSQFLSTKRDIIVYVPPGYDQSGERYPVFYLQDGQNLFDPATAFGGQDWHAAETADDLIHRGIIKPVILVGIYNTGVRRISEYTPTRCPKRRKGGKADRYAEMLAREIKPFVDHEYRTRKGPAHSGVGGSSLGALTSLVAAFEFPKVFGKVAMMSPSVWWDSRAIVKMVESNTVRRPQPRIWLDIGTAEGDTADQIVADVRALGEALIAKGWIVDDNLKYTEVEGAGHNEAAWAARFGDVLAWLFPRR